MTPEQQVPTLETCKKLDAARFPHGSTTYFVWYTKDVLRPHRVVKRTLSTSQGGSWLAPTAQELLTEFSIMILKDGEINEEIADRVDNLVLHCWTEPNLAQLLAELWLETRKEVQP